MAKNGLSFVLLLVMLFLGTFTHSVPVIAQTTDQNIRPNIGSQGIVTNVDLVFNSNGGSAVATISQAPGSALTAPTDPTRQDYTFAGWYSDEALTQAFSFSTMPLVNTTVYAKWTFNYEVVFETNNGGTISPTYAKKYELEPTTLTIGTGITYNSAIDKLIVGDFTNDGFDDVIVHDNNKKIVVYINQKDGTFARSDISVTFSTILWNHKVVDLNNDNLLDVVLAYDSGGGLRYLLSNGDGTFQGPTLVSLASDGFLGVDVIDYDKDGDMDIFATGYTEAFVYNNNGSLSFTKSSLGTYGSYGRAMTAGDINGDQIVDVIFSNNYSSWYRFGNGDGTFAPVNSFPLASNIPFYLEDANQNDINEVVFQTYSSIYKFEWDPVSSSFKNIASSFTSTAYFAQGMWIDLNNDSVIDFIAVNGNANGYLAAVSSSFGDYNVTNVSVASIGGVAAGDFYNDGNYYIFAASNSTNSVSAFEKTKVAGYLVKKPTNPTKTGYSFDKWVETGETSSFDFTQYLNAGTTTLEAQWTINQYTITFDSNEGPAVSSITQNYNTDVTAPTEPTLTGYTFGGWYSDEALTTAYTFNKMPAENITLYAKWTIKETTISFDSNEGSAVTAIKQNYDTVVSAPTAPTKTGYTFNGWYADSQLTSAYTFNKMPADNMTLYAKWSINQYTISFDSNEGPAVSSITQNYNTDVTAPTEPTLTGYTFGGWYSNQALTTAYTFNKMPAENITLFGKWTINEYTISFNTNEGSAVNAIKQNYNTNVSAPTAPTKTGYTFNGWYTNSQLTSAYTFNKMPAENITLYAKWTINQYTISFDSNEGPAVSSITQNYNTNVAAPTNPTLSGYVFGGWYSDESLTTPFEFTTMPAQNLTLYAKWNAIYTLTINVDGVVTTQSGITGTSVTPVTNPTKEGYIFKGWYPALPTQIGSSNLTVTATWLKVSQGTNDVDANFSNILDAIDPTLMAGSDAEVTLNIIIKSAQELSPEDITLLKNLVKNELKINGDFVYLDIFVNLTVEGNSQRLSNLTDAIQITIHIPTAYQGKNHYHILRIHEGVAEVLDTLYDSETQTLTFMTDRFSTYAIAFEGKSNFLGDFILLILLLLAGGFVLFFGRKKDFFTNFFKPTTPVAQSQVSEKTTLQLKEVKLANVTKRPLFRANTFAASGDYLEVTPQLETTNRLVQIVDQPLPPVVGANNSYLALEKAEVVQFQLAAMDLSEYTAKTPGSYVEEGYYMEVDLNQHPVNNFIYTKQRLAPTTTKGHRWVRIQPRKLKNA